MIQDDSRITDCIDESSSICVYQNYKEREKESEIKIWLERWWYTY